MFNRRKPSIITISAVELLGLIETQCNIAFIDCLVLEERVYTLPHPSQVGDFLARNKVDGGEYRPEVHDCDNFTKELAGDASKERILMGNIKVRIAGMRTAHKLNMTVLSDKSVIYIEPQTDEVIEPSRRIQILDGAI